MNEPAQHAGGRGFTLVELLVSMALIVLMMVLLVSIINSTGRTLHYTSAKVEEFKQAREAFETMTRQLSQSTLNTYWDYDNPTAPTNYFRQSDLRFVSGNAATLTGEVGSPTHAVFFQAPLGYVSVTTYTNPENLLNTWGYFIEFGDDSQTRPPFLNNVTPAPPVHSRFRLVELMEPSEQLSLYKYTSGLGKYQANTPNNSLYLSSSPPGGYTGFEWFTDPLKIAVPNRPVHVLAENIIAFVVLPKLSPRDDSTGTKLAPAYTYDSTASKSDATINSKNQLPPLVQVSMVAVDETSFNRYQQGATRPMPDPLFANSPFTDSSAYATDMQALQTALVSAKLNYRLFTTTVSINAAKWSRYESN